MYLYKKINLNTIFIFPLLSLNYNILYSQAAGSTLFDETSIHTIEINFTQPDYWNLLIANKAFDDTYDSSSYIPAQVIIDGEQIDSTGIQFKGNSSYYNYPTDKKPFTLSFDEYITGQQYDGLKSINLNNGYQDPTMLREKMFLDFCNKAGIYAPRANYTKLFINGNYWGLYLLCERVNNTFCNTRFGNNDGNLFKGDNYTSACANLQYHGVMDPYYSCYTLKNNETENYWTDLVNLTYQINMVTDAQFYDSVANVLNTTSFIKAWAAYNLFCNFDSYPFRFKHNYYIYDNSSTGKFDWIVWDVSTAFGIDIPMPIDEIENISITYLTPPIEDAPLSKRMTENSNFNTEYLNTICDFANNYFIADTLNALVDSLANLIRSDYYADPNKMYSDINFEDNLIGNINLGFDIPGLKTFITARSAAVLNELDSLGLSCKTTNIDTYNDFFGISLFPNPFYNKAILQINGNNFKNCTVTLSSITGSKIFSDVVENNGSGIINYTIDMKMIPAAGIYFITVSNNLFNQTLKIIKL